MIERAAAAAAGATAAIALGRLGRMRLLAPPEPRHRRGIRWRCSTCDPLLAESAAEAAARRLVGEVADGVLLPGPGGRLRVALAPGADGPSAGLRGLGRDQVVSVGLAAGTALARQLQAIPLIASRHARLRLAGRPAGLALEVAGSDLVIAGAAADPAWRLRLLRVRSPDLAALALDRLGDLQLRERERVHRRLWELQRMAFASEADAGAAVDRLHEAEGLVAWDIIAHARFDADTLRLGRGRRPRERRGAAAGPHWRLRLAVVPVPRPELERRLRSACELAVVAVVGSGIRLGDGELVRGHIDGSGLGAELAAWLPPRRGGRPGSA